MTKITHKFLVEQGAKWLHKKASNVHYRSPFVVTEFVCQGVNEYPDIFGLRPHGHVLIEVKTSRRDYKRDFKKLGRNNTLDQLGNIRFYLTPKDLIKINELPEKWGLLEWNGKKIEVIKKPEQFEGDFQAAGYIYHSILRRKNKYQIFDFKK